jgi:hypothetical protein
MKPTQSVRPVVEEQSSELVLEPDSVNRVVDEFEGVMLGDPRRTARVLKFVEKLARAPSSSLPAALGNAAELEGAYRLANNENVTFEALLAAHVKATAAGARKAGRVLVLHDTTDCSFRDLDPKEIGYLNTGKAGFRLHLSLAVSRADWRKPLGIVNAEPLFRSKRSRSKKKKRSGSETRKDADREFERWYRGVDASRKALEGCDLLHIKDREGDSYELMSQELAIEQKFIIRVRTDRRSRRVGGSRSDWSTVKRVAAEAEGVLQREVPLSRRKGATTPATNKAHPPRKMRLATLRFSATRIEIPRPQYLSDPAPKTLTLNLVRVYEINAPAGQEPVEWLLYTTEPINTPEEIAEVVDNYRTRWLIEEFNAALKTGVAYEDRQFETRHALLVMLALSLPIACELLWLRSRARTNPNAPATEVLTPVQIEVLRELGSKKLSSNPTAEEALLAVAAMGGHLKRNGPPGWKVLHRGMVLLNTYEAGWSARGARDGRRVRRDGRKM